MKQRDLVIVPWPFSDFKTSKFRPAIVLSNDEYNTNTREVMLCAVKPDK